MVSVISTEENIYVPNAFSPNSKGYNDFLMVFASRAVEQIDLFSIYDRWGNLIFQKENLIPNIESEGWDGFFVGEPMNAGVYVYKLIYTNNAGEKVEKSGDVILLR